MFKRWNLKQKWNEAFPHNLKILSLINLSNMWEKSKIRVLEFAIQLLMYWSFNWLHILNWFRWSSFINDLKERSEVGLCNFGVLEWRLLIWMCFLKSWWFEKRYDQWIESECILLISIGGFRTAAVNALCWRRILCFLLDRLNGIETETGCSKDFIF
jgi:hypothetical protein